MQVKDRTSNSNTYAGGSHVMEYGNTSITAEKLYLYQGFDPASVNFPPNAVRAKAPLGVVNQRDADLLFLWHLVRPCNCFSYQFVCNKYIDNDQLIWFILQYKKAEGTEKKSEILNQITETKRHRNHLDGSVDLIGVLLYGPKHGPTVLNSVRAEGLPLVDDWQCLKSMVLYSSDLLCFNNLGSVYMMCII